MKKKSIVPLIGLCCMAFSFAHLWFYLHGVFWFLRETSFEEFRYMSSILEWLKEQTLVSSFVIWIRSIFSGFVGGLLLYVSD
jgi:hypothetical protein